jgi:arylsulfatase A-like enzyme
VRRALATLAALGAGLGPLTPLSAQETRPPNVVVIVADDMRWDELHAMPNVGERLAAGGVVFTDAFVVNPLCCPSRASILTGNHSHTTGVYRQTLPFGRWDAFDDSSTLATWLDDAGYDTALVGKYLDGYQRGALAGYVPPGWDRWVAFVHSAYFDYELTVDGEVVRYGDGPADYATTVLADEAVSFVERADGPLFLYFAPPAPHAPATPPPGAAGSVPAWEPPSSFGEADVSDKPAYVRRLRPIGADRMDDFARIEADRLLTIRAVDEAVGRILDALASTGRLDDTLVVFTSDNGVLLGEHRWTKKEVPYEEAIRVPLVVRYDPLVDGPRAEAGLALNIDIAPTVADLAGVVAPSMDGRSLRPLLAGEDTDWRTDLLIEHMEGSNRVPTYCAVRTATTKYVVYATGEEELYALDEDPHELDNLAGDPARAGELVALRARLRELCDPPPPGFDAPRTFAWTWAAVGVLALVLTAGAARQSRRPAA